MAHILFEVSPLNGSTPVTLRMALNTSDPTGVQLNGYSWQPIIIERSARTISLSNEGLLSEIQSDYGTLSFSLHPDFNNEIWSSYEWSGALGRIFVGNLGAPFSSYVQTFEGSVSSMEREGAKATVTLLGPEAILDKPLLTAAYTGTGNAEGPTALKGTLKPRAFGNCQCVDPVLIDPAKWIYQVHGYGPVASITAYEFAQALDPAKKKPDCANFAALAALTLLPGEWGTCLAEGLFRLGGTPAKKVSADLTFSGSQNISTIVPALLAVAGVPGAKIGSFSAFSSVGWDHYQTTQITVGEVARTALRQAGGYLIADGTGVWRCGNYFAPKSPATIADDGSTPVNIRMIKELAAPPPVWKVSVGYHRCWNVHNASDVSPAIAEISDAAEAANDAAIAAQASADAAAANANAQKARLDNMVSDSVLDRSEKAQIILEASRLTAEKAGLNSQATGLGITTENTAYNSAYSTWLSYLTALTPAYTDTTQDTSGLVRTTWNTRWTDLYAARQSLLNKIAEVAATRATWSSVQNIPGALTDGRVAAGLASNGDIQRVLPGSKLPNSAGNLIVDPLLADVAAWSFPSANWSIDSTSPELSTYGLVRAFKHLPANGNARVNSKLVPAQAGASYNCTMRVVAKAGVSGTMEHTIRFFDRAGNYLNQAFKNYSVGAPSSDTVIDCSVTGTAPAGTAFVGSVNNMGAWTTGSVWTGAYSIRPVATPALVNLGDTANMVPDADFLDAPATWGISKIAVAPNTTAGKGAGVNKLVIDSAAGTESAQTALIACSPGETLRSSVYLETVSGTTGNLLIAPQFYNAAGGYLGYGTFVIYAAGESGSFSSISRAPANTASVRYFIYNYGAGNRVWHLSEPIMYRATILGRNAVREDGITPITDSSAITSLGTAAAIIAQSPWATYSVLPPSRLEGIAPNATANIITRSSTAPASPNDGDFWVDTSATPHVTKVRVGGAWQIGSNFVTDTAHLVDGAGLGDTAVWEWVLDRPTSVATLNPTDGAHLAGIETNADVTSQVTGTAEIVVNCDHTGTPLDGQLPKTSQFRLVRAGADVTTTATWSRSVASGSVSCTIGSATGTLSVTSITSDAVVRVAAEYNGVTRVFDVKVTRSLAAPPNTGGSGSGSGGTAANDTTFSTISSTAMAAITDELTVTIGSTGEAILSATTAFYSGVTGYYTVYSIWQQWNGSAWVDGPGEVAGYDGYNPTSSGGPGGDVRPIIETDPAYDGYLENNLTITGLTVGTTQKFRLRARGSTSFPVYFHSSVASVQG